MNKKINHHSQRFISLILVLVLCIGMIPAAFAAQDSCYHDPAESWLSVSGSRTNELDANAVVTQETFYCDECGDYRSFTVWRTPEYTKDGATALSRNVRYSDGTFVDGSGTGSILDGTPGVDAYYTGYHWTKAICDTCGTINANLGSYDYGFGVNVYWLYDCDAAFVQALEEETAYEYVSSSYHKVTTTSGSYCGFCYGTCYTEESELERHNMDYTVIAEQGNLRFVRTGVCADCGYTTVEYVTAKAVIQSYLGTVDGDAHTIVVSDLSDLSVSVSIRYGLTANSCTLTTAPTYTEAGTNYVYYAITYTYKDAEMTENGVAYVTLVEAADTGSSSASSCGCGDADCNCAGSSCSGNCCGTCSGCSHSNYYSYTIDPTCTALGYTKYICLDCGMTWKSDYVSALGHLYQYFTTSEATCETAGKTIGICLHCGLVTTETTDKTDHKYSTYTVAATCTSPGYTVHECSVCGNRYISDITAILSHSYTATTTAATCTTSGKTVYTCADCGGSYVGSYVAAYGHNYVAAEITAATCGGAGVTQYKCSLCGDTYLVAGNATGHTLSDAATCTEAQYCLECGAIITLPTGHDYTAYVTEPSCTEGGYTTHICANCGDSYVDSYTDAHGHSYTATQITAASCNGAGVTQYKCADCGDTYLVAENATGHTLGDEATCTAPQLCTECGTVIENALGHDYIAEVVDANCTTMGYTVYTCSRCGESYKSDYTEAAGHSYEATMTEPTCTEGGYTTYVCNSCGDSYIADYTEAHGHNYVATEITTSTCNGAGVTQHKCSACGDSYLVAENATGHTPNGDATCTEESYCIDCGAILALPTRHDYEAVATEATCTEGGYTTYTCGSCGDSYIADYTDALGHTVVAESITLPTCNGAGVTQYTCLNCGEHYLEAESATGHNINGEATCTEASYCLTCGAILALPMGHDYEAVVTEPTCLEGGYTTYTCANCGDSYVADYTEALGHTWDEGRIVTDSVCDSEGVIEYRCESCGYHRLEAVSVKGHTPGDEATCTAAQLCTVCGAILAEPTGHSYEAAVTEPTCTELGYTTYICAACGDSYVADYVNAAGHTASDWIVDVEPTTSAEGSKHKECADCGKVLETESIDKIYLFGYTDVYGETVIGDYLVTVTDTSSENPVPNAAVMLGEDGTLYVVLPDGRLIDYAAQTTITVLLKEDETPVPDVSIVVTDENNNYAGGETDEDGKLTVPSVSGVTNADGRVTVGGTDASGSLITLTVNVEDFESARPIEGAIVTVTNGVLDVLLPDGTDMDEGNRILVTVLDNAQTPVCALDVTVRNDLGKQEQGQTNKDGKLIVPALSSAYTDEDGTAILGKYTVIVTDSGDKPVSGAFVTLIESEGGDSFTVLLPDGRLLDANDQTTVTVLLPSAEPAVGLGITVSDENGNHAAKDTDSAGQVTVPDKSGSSGETVGKDTGSSETSNTVNVSVIDEGGREIAGADVTVNDDGSVDVELPEDFNFEEDGRVTVTVTDNQGEAKEGVSVTVTDGDGVSAEGETDKYGKLTVPADVETAEHIAYVIGYGDGTFAPSSSMTRAEAAAVFARLLAAKNGDVIYDNVHCSFSDVSGKAWYAGYVKYLETFGIINGYEDGTFRPEQTITRAEFVAMSVRFYAAYGIEITEAAELPAFTDVSVDDWAFEYIAEAASNGWVIGYGNGFFEPDDEITRAEVVTIVNRVLGREADAGYISANYSGITTFTDVPKSYWAYYEILEAANAHTASVVDDAESWLDN